MDTNQQNSSQSFKDYKTRIGHYSTLTEELMTAMHERGIGVNVWRPAAENPMEGKNTPAYLAEIARNGLEREQDVQMVVDFVGDEVMNVFWRRYAQWQREGFVPFVDEFNACNALNGKHVDIADRNGRVVKSGIVTGVNANGSLLIGDDPVSSGEAHIL